MNKKESAERLGRLIELLERSGIDPADIGVCVIMLNMKDPQRIQREREYVREYRKRTNNSATKRYEKTKNGFLMRCYRNMKSRVSGVQTTKYHLYKNKYLLPRESFYEWAKSSDDFHRLFDRWKAAGYNRKLTPSVNRIDPSLGYEVGNMEWITHSENSRLGGYWKPSGL